MIEDSFFTLNAQSEGVTGVYWQAIGCLGKEEEKEIFALLFRLQQLPVYAEKLIKWQERHYL